MASYLRPRRGTLSASSSIVLKKGEVFFEFKGNPATTSGGTSCGCIKMGNGTTVYNSLGYFLNPTTDVVTWASTTASGLPSDWGSYGGSTATSASQGSDLYDDLNALISGDQNMKVFPLIKNLLYKLCTQVTKLNNEYDRNSAEFLNSYYKGYSNNLGTITSANVNTFLAEHIVNGKFYGITLGDLVTINDGTYNAPWVVVGFDTEYNNYDITRSGNILNVHHISLLPASPLQNSRMNASNVTTGGYKGSEMHTTTLPAIVTKLQTALGARLLKRTILVSNTVNTSVVGGSSMSGTSSNWEWLEVYASLLSEVQVYGSTVFSGGFDIGEASTILPIYKFVKFHQSPFSRSYFWLRGVASSAYFCIADNFGNAGYSLASNACGVRPLIILG